MQALSNPAQPRSTAQAKLLIQTTEDLKQWSTQLVEQRRKLRVTQAHVLGTLGDVVAHQAMGKTLERADAKALDRRFDDNAPVSAFGALA